MLLNSRREGGAVVHLLRAAGDHEEVRRFLRSLFLIYGAVFRSGLSSDELWRLRMLPLPKCSPSELMNADLKTSELRCMSVQRTKDYSEALPVGFKFSFSTSFVQFVFQIF